MWHSELKLALGAQTGLSQDALHVHAAIILYLAAMLVLRRGLGSPLPWLIVLALELVNEALDLADQYSVGRNATWGEALEGGWDEALKDVLNTMVWPTVMLIVGHFVRPPGPSEAEDGPSD